MGVFKRFLSKITQTCVITFVFVSVVYTTKLFFLGPLSSLAFRLLGYGSPRTTLPFSPRGMVSFGEKYTSDMEFLGSDRQYFLSQDGSADQASIFSWTSSRFTLENGLGHSGAIYLDEKLVLSKAFSNAMRPSNIKPYFYRAKGSFKADDITITTLITSNRFQVFARLVEKYQGPISVTVHIKDVAEHVEGVLEALHHMYTSSETMRTFVDVHLVVDVFDRQFNTWRNIARLFARTEFVMMLDIDFYPCTDFRSVINQSSTISDKLYAGRAALVIPAFEYVDFAEGTNYAAFPTKKSDLLELVKNQRIGMFHASWGPGHNSSDYARFYSAPTGEAYKVSRYQSAYEPYVIFKKDGPPWCDERFVGYGGNKAACLFEMYLAGISFYVLSDHFIIHQNHLYEESARKSERKHNRRIYADFKEETCLRYLKTYHEHAVLHSDIAENAISECKKLKSVVRSVPKVRSTNLQVMRTVNMEHFSLSL